MRMRYAKRYVKYIIFAVLGYVVLFNINFNGLGNSSRRNDVNSVVVQQIATEGNRVLIPKKVFLDKEVKLTRDEFDTECLNLLPNVSTDALDKWYTVRENPTVHVYSAYYDNRQAAQPTVKVIGTGNGSPMGVWCQVWLKVGNKVTLHITPVKHQIVPETHGFRFSPFVYSCDVPLPWLQLRPTYVALVTDKCAHTDKTLTIQNRPEPFEPRYNFTVCLTPINRNYEHVGEFLDFVEVNGMFGADHFILYDHGIGKKIRPFIESYIRDDIVEVLAWKIPLEATQGPLNQIHYFGQVVALNDCLYRARTKSRYVVMIDLDEIITPLKHKTWLEYMQTTNKLETFSSFNFRNVFFRREWEKDSTYSNHPVVQKLGLQTLQYTKREKTIWAHQQRSKWIADPNRILLGGIHNPWGVVQGYSDVRVDAKDALLFHYRDWEDYINPPNFEVERRMFDFTDEIIHRVEKRVEKAKLYGYDPGR